MTISTPHPIAVIGAGITGITVARRLAAAGHQAVIFEKSRGLGGRLSTRTSRSGVQFDHGAQYLTVRGDGFKAFLDETVQHGSGAIWEPDGKADKPTKIVGTPRMNALLAPFADGLDIRFEHTVAPLTRDGDRWAVTVNETGETHWFDFVVSTVPSVQARALVGGVSGLTAALDRVAMVPCWTLMAAFDTPLTTHMVIHRDHEGDIAWIARDSHKPGRDLTRDQWVIHASPAWSTANLEAKKEDVATQLLAMSAPILGGNLPTAPYLAAHRWRYAMASTPLGKAFLHTDDQRILVGGDWCLGARAEDGFDSGTAMADRLLTQL
ncbi:MAG: FAD-dependent oxidoreductase [Pseudomonadota bacterium]